MDRDEKLIHRDELLDWTDLILAKLHDVSTNRELYNFTLILDHLIEADLRAYGDNDEEEE
jgi:hypothetical protein